MIERSSGAWALILSNGRGTAVFSFVGADLRVRPKRETSTNRAIPKVRSSRDNPPWLSLVRTGTEAYPYGDSEIGVSFRRMPESGDFSFLLYRFQDRPAMFLSSSALANLSVGTRMRRNDDQRRDAGKAGFAMTAWVLLNRYQDCRPPPGQPPPARCVAPYGAGRSINPGIFQAHKNCGFSSKFLLL